MRISSLLVTAVIITALLVAGCSRLLDPAENSAKNGDTELQQLMLRPLTLNDPAPPAALVTVAFGNKELTFWPYTTDNFSSEEKDPINLIFVGFADPLDIRAALLALDGDRTSLGLPSDPPFNARWDDETAGDIQASYDPADGWVGGSIQLSCGEFGPIRFHVRLFKMGDWTVANAHFELQVPGTSTHQVLSWELAEQFVIGDLIRSGLLDSNLPMMPTQPINPAPYQTIPAMLYNLLPPELRTQIGGPAGDVTADVDILTDGRATILNLAGRSPRIPEVRTKNYVLQFGQAVPKPFCASGPGDYVYVQGPVQMSQTTSLTSSGVFNATFHAEGQLLVTPINPLTGEPIGETLTAEVYEHHSAHLGHNRERVSSLLSQHILPDTAAGAGRLFVRFRVNSEGQSGYQAIVRCADNPYEEISEGNMPAALQGPAVAPGANFSPCY
jgi:hypothetical protein